MDKLLILSRIDEELDSSEVNALCFLCRDVVKRKRLQGIKDAKGLFLRLEESGMMENNSFLSQLLNTIRRKDLLNLLVTDSKVPEEADALPPLSTYRVMLYKIYMDITQENLDKMKFLLNDKLGRSRMETSSTALDLFVEMEKADLLSSTKLDELHRILKEFDQQLALILQHYMNNVPQQNQIGLPPFEDHQRGNNNIQPMQTALPVAETQHPFEKESVHTDAEPNGQPSPVLNETDYYTLNHIPRGLCVIINNEKFSGKELNDRGGTQEDAKALNEVFSSLGFTVLVHDNLTAAGIRQELKKLGRFNFFNHDAMVLCVLSHGENGCIFGTNEEKVGLRELTQPFSGQNAPTLVGKPKLFFIQACQGSNYQEGSVLKPPSSIEEEVRKSRLEEDAGPIQSETVPWDADFLLGMATVPQCKSFRNTMTGSIYIQELCRQLKTAADSHENVDILTVLTRVNREVSKGVFLTHKQMPEPKYTLTKKLVLRYV